MRNDKFKSALYINIIIILTKELTISNLEIVEVSANNLSQKYQQDLIDFLFKHLEKFGDTKEAITRCFDYFKSPDKGGHLFLANDDENLIGVCIILKTHMDGFLPENFLVYIAVNSEYRGKGIGKMMMNTIKSSLKGDICLHVEADNPAKRLYEREGFTNKYLEMRFHR